MDDLVESGCAVHSTYWHATVHESAHAVAAIDNEIAFDFVVMYGEKGGPKSTAVRKHLGEVVMFDCDPTTWVPLNPLGALCFLLAGSLGEEAVLGDEDGDEGQGDFGLWRAGAGLADASPVERYQALLGRPLDDVVAATTDWANANRERVERLAAHLAELPPCTTVPRDRVVEVLQGS
jgi:hypothetical protein